MRYKNIKPLKRPLRGMSQYERKLIKWGGKRNFNKERKEELKKNTSRVSARRYFWRNNHSIYIAKEHIACIKEYVYWLEFYIEQKRKRRK